ncbi:amidohydrolase family protein [Microbispora sp. NPDC046933]|uniref:amidohydrolase family protein n=1 Tax=Microbispora sp. NPDC046933 TaxID=3155618 RepID=UPI0033FA3D68
MTERFAVIRGGEVIGRITVDRAGADLLVEYAVDDNGRGARLRERITLGDRGIPLAWEIDGTSLMGGPVRERLQDGTWECQADRGRAPAGAGRLYLANDTSPYSSGIYARAALAHGGAVDVLPSGRLTLEPLRQVLLGERALQAYVLGGAGLLPEFVLLDADRRMVARLGGTLMLRELVVREDHLDDADDLAALDTTLSIEHLSLVGGQVRHTCDSPVRIRDVRIFDPRTLRLGDPHSVVFYRGMITSVEPDAPGTGVEIDGQGGTLLAGLHDMHAHNSLATGLFYLAAGVTTTRDMGNDNDMLLALMPRLDSGELPGPSIVPSGLIEGRSPYSARIGVIPGTLDEALGMVRWYAERGYHQIKIYNSVDPAWVEPLAAEAHRLGLRVTGHVPAFATPDQMIEAGYDEIAHLNQLMLGWVLDPGEDTRTPLRLTAMTRAKDLDLASPQVRRTIGLMRERGVGLDTTAVILERLMLSRAGQVQEGDQAYLDHMPVGYQRYRKRTFVPNPADGYDEAFSRLLETMASLHAEGVELWPGTDDGTGFTLHRELELYCEAGIPAAEVVRRATLDCARHLGRDHMSGSVARGKRADLILVDGDPTRDISALRRVRMTVKGGDVYFPAEIHSALSIAPFTVPPPVKGASW